MPAAAREIALSAGSVLFVPSGWWHATEASRESLALMFIIKHVDWTDVIFQGLRTELHKRVRWRRFALGARSLNPRFRKEAVQEISILLDELKMILEGVRAQDIAAPTFYRPSGVRCSRKGHTISIVGHRWKATLELGLAERRIFDAIQSFRGRITLEQLVATGLNAERVAALLLALVEVEYLIME
jgi:hypothetical protein